MMEKRVSAWEARRNFGKVLKDVSMNRQAIVIESHGEEVAVVVPLSTYEAVKRQREDLKTQIRTFRESINLTEDEADALVEEAMIETGRLPE